jgi:hypothetical protein
VWPCGPQWAQISTCSAVRWTTSPSSPPRHRLSPNPKTYQPIYSAQSTQTACRGVPKERPTVRVSMSSKFRWVPWCSSSYRTKVSISITQTHWYSEIWRQWRCRWWSSQFWRCVVLQVVTNVSEKRPQDGGDTFAWNVGNHLFIFIESLRYGLNILLPMASNNGRKYTKATSINRRMCASDTSWIQNRT